MKTKERTPAQVAESAYNDLRQIVGTLRKCEEREKWDRAEVVRDRIREEPLSCEATKRYEILLSWGGPACRIVGELDEYGEPESARIEGQDWFTPWVAFEGADESILLDYARCFYFGE